MAHIAQSFKPNALLISWLLLCAGLVDAHEMTPAYPEMKPSYVDGVYKLEMSIFNYRDDVEYYQLSVFDRDWGSIPFASPDRIVKVSHNQRKDFAVYLRQSDVGRAVYLCSTSKLRSREQSFAFVSSKICSRLDGAKP